MKFIDKFNIKTKILFGFFLICFMFTVSSLIINMKIGKINEKSDEYAYIKKYNDQALELQLNISNIWQFFTDASLTLDIEVINTEAKSSYNNCKSLIANLEQMNISDKEIKNALPALKSKIDNIYKVGEKMFFAYKNSKSEGDIVMDEYDKVCSECIEFTNSFVKNMSLNLNEISKEINNSSDFAQQLSIILVISILIVSMIFGILLSNAISRRLKIVTKSIEYLTLGDFESFNKISKDF